MAVRPGHVLIAGASGVIGAGALEAFAGAGWRVTALSRRRPVVADRCAFTHVSADFDDRDACAALIADLPPVTHLVYAAVAEAPGLVSGWRDAALIERNGRMFANVLDPLAARGDLAHVSLLQGTKAYGAHYHEVELPPREDRPRDDHPNFYWLHEDHARLRAGEHGFGFTVWRPQVLFGHAPGAAMNPVAPIGAYAALCREMGLPFAYPARPTRCSKRSTPGCWPTRCCGRPERRRRATRSSISPTAMCSRRATPGGTSPRGSASGRRRTRRAASSPSSRKPTCRRRGRVWWSGTACASPALPALLGESHHYADLLLGSRIAEKSLPVLLSTIKLRRAGFPGCCDSTESLLHWIGRMVELKLLPPFGDRA